MGTQITLDRLGEFKALENGCIASIETATASKAYAIGDRFYLAGKLCVATADIAIGDTIELDSNCKLDVLGDDVALLERTVENDNLYHKILKPYEVAYRSFAESARPRTVDRNMYYGQGGIGSINYWTFMLANDNYSRMYTGNTDTVVATLADRPQLFIPTSVILNNLNEAFGLFVKTDVTSIASGRNVSVYFVYGDSDGESVTNIVTGSYLVTARPFLFFNPSIKNLSTHSHFSIAIMTNGAFTGSIELGLAPYRTTANTAYVPSAQLFKTELSNTATQAYAVNDLVYVWATLYKVTAPIASGEAFTEGTNIVQTTLGEQITALLNAQ